MEKFIFDKIFKNVKGIFSSKEDFLNLVYSNNKIKLPCEDVLNKKQKTVVSLIEKQKSNLFLILYGGIRSGKTYLAVYLFILNVINSPPKSLFIATGYNISILRTNIEQILDEFGLVMGKDYVYNGLLYRYKINDKVIRICGANNKRSYSNIRGCTATGWYANEVVLQDMEVVNECIRRVSKKGFRFKIWDTNPSNSSNKIYTDFISKSESKGIVSVKFKTDDNIENLPEGYIEEQRSLLCENDQKLYLDGEWLESLSMPFFKLRFSDYDIRKFKFSNSDRLAFLDPATGHHKNSSMSALSIIFKVNYGSHYTYYFMGKLYKGLWANHLDDMARFLNEYGVSTFLYEDNLIGKGVVERDESFRARYIGNISSIRNSTEKIARISSLIAPIEKGTLVALKNADSEFNNYIKSSNISKDNKYENLDAIDSLESCYRIITMTQ